MSRLVQRSQRLAFYGVLAEDGSYTFTRMSGFTDMTVSKNPREYKRQYIDEAFEQTDVTGYSPAISYGFDLYEGNAVQEDIIGIADGEKTGDMAVRPIVMVDLTKQEQDGSCAAVKRDFAVIPEGEGKGSDAYTYQGSFKVKGEKILGRASTTDDWQTITFTV